MNSPYAIILSAWKKGGRMDISDIKKMSLVERLRALELLWNSLSHDENELESPEWHKKALADRKKNLQSAKMIPLAKVKKELSR